jgi:hypothetical protein
MEIAPLRTPLPKMYVAFFKKYELFFKYPKNIPNHYPEPYPPKEKMLRTEIWNTFLET